MTVDAGRPVADKWRSTSGCSAAPALSFMFGFFSEFLSSPLHLFSHRSGRPKTILGLYLSRLQGWPQSMWAKLPPSLKSIQSTFHATLTRFTNYEKHKCKKRNIYRALYNQHKKNLGFSI